LPKGVEPARGDWLRRQQPPRRRAWALEEQLFGRLETIVERDTYRPLVDPRPTQAELNRDYWLCRCEGFTVESPSGHVGFVEGLRFRTRVDIPDLLEVSAGRLGRKVVLVPVSQVETIESEEEVLVLREDPVSRRRRLPAAVLRLGFLTGATPRS
jgi:hypothetical protein